MALLGSGRSGRSLLLARRRVLVPGRRGLLLARRSLVACGRAFDDVGTRRGRGRRRLRYGNRGRLSRRGRRRRRRGRRMFRLHDTGARLRAHGDRDHRSDRSRSHSRRRRDRVPGSRAVSLAGDRRRLNDASAGARPERDAERGWRRREQPRDQRAAGDGDREQQRGDQALLPAHVLPLSRRQLLQGLSAGGEIGLSSRGSS